MPREKATATKAGVLRGDFVHRRDDISESFTEVSEIEDEVYTIVKDWEREKVLLEITGQSLYRIPSYPIPMFETPTLDRLSERERHHAAAVDAIAGKGSYAFGFRPQGDYLKFAYRNSRKRRIGVVFDARLYDPGGKYHGGKWVWVPTHLLHAYLPPDCPISSDLQTALRPQNYLCFNPPKQILRRRASGMPLYPHNRPLNAQERDTLSFLFLLPGVGEHTARMVHRTVTVDAPTPFEVKGALLDSGALRASYISRRIYQQHEAQLAPFTRKCRHEVNLAGTGSKREIDTVVSLQIHLRDETGKACPAFVDFYVLETDMPMVIGLPALAGPLLLPWTQIWLRALSTRNSSRLPADGEGKGQGSAQTDGNTDTGATFFAMGPNTQFPTGPMPACTEVRLIVSDAETMLFVNPDRAGSRLGGIQLPGGSLEPGQTLIEGIVSQLRLVTGYEVDSERLLPLPAMIRQEERDTGGTKPEIYTTYFFACKRADLAYRELPTPATPHASHLWLTVAQVEERALTDLRGLAPDPSLVPLEALKRYSGPDAVKAKQPEPIPESDWPLGHADYPWRSAPERAPEEDVVPEPVMFRDYLYFTEMGIPAALEEYYKLASDPKIIEPEHLAAKLKGPDGQPTTVKAMLAEHGCLGSQVFVPSNWQGINGVEPIKLDLKPGWEPPTKKPPARWINPTLMPVVLTELRRLMEHMFNKSVSPTCSPLVAASKETFPFTRLCGDYRLVNQGVQLPHYPIPNVQHALHKIRGFKLFSDLDMTNSFHQLPLHPMTSALLSIQTPLGQLEPKFMPEGVSPASGWLQKIVSEIFADFDEWIVVIFDNFLVLGHDHQDLHDKTRRVLERCRERNIFLKMSKSRFGHKTANFFGYVVDGEGYYLSEQRTEALMAIPMPANEKQMRSFLGMALFFKNHIPRYADWTAQLNDMVHKDFPWKHKERWKADYEGVFAKFKEKIRDSVKVFYPDYDLPWVLRTDASETGVGGVLFQVAKGPDGEDVSQPLAFVSKKFSDPATRWSTIEQETFAIVHCVTQLSYLLRGKHFELQTDHRNALWLESSSVPKLIRWRLYLASFNFTLRHIPGKLNIEADFLSRTFLLFSMLPTETLELLEPAAYPDMLVSEALLKLSYIDFVYDAESYPPDSSILAPLVAAADAEAGADSLVDDELADGEAMLTPDEILAKVHGGRAGHHGAKRTMALLNKHFPGHAISQALVEDYVASCWNCQKNRLPRAVFVEPIVRHIKPPGKRSALGIDTLTISPPDKHGNNYVIVLVNLYTKLCQLYPVKNKDELTTARVLFKHLITFGVVDELHSDPGSDLTSGAVKQLNQWFGVHHQLSLVDRHTSSGVEQTNNLILRHIKALIYDERLRESWSDDECLGFVQFILNSSDNSETGVIPYVAHYGTADATYHRLPSDLPASQQPHALLKLLDEQLQRVKQVSDEFQGRLIAERLAANPARPNQYQPGDLVVQRVEKMARKDKLQPVKRGPFEVKEHVKNDVRAQHLHGTKEVVLPAETLEAFFAPRDLAERAAEIDDNQYKVEAVLAYEGDTEMRQGSKKARGCTFTVRFADKTVVHDLPWSQDLAANRQFQDFLAATPACFPLRFSKEELKVVQRDLRSQPVSLKPGDIRYVDIRGYGADWYVRMDLPDHRHTTYVVKYEFSRLDSKQGKGKQRVVDPKKIIGRAKVFKTGDQTFDEYWVKCYGKWPMIQPGHVLVDNDFVKRFPRLLV